MNYVMNWIVLLNLSRTATVLNAETDGGASSLALARRVKTVYALANGRGEAERMRHAAEAQGVGNMTVLDAHPDRALPLSAGSVDAVILHDADRMLPEHGTRAALARLLGEAHRVLSPEGQLYLGATNRWGYPRLTGGAARSGWVSRSTAQRLTRGAGFRALRTFGFYPAIDRIEEVVGWGGASFDGAVTLKEHVKSVVRNARAFQWMAPAFGLVADKGAPASGVVERVVADLAARTELHRGQGRSWRVMRCLGLQRKVVLLLGRLSAGRHAELAVHLPLDAEAEHRLRHEQRTLAALERSTTQMRRWAPRFFIEGRVESQAYFAMEAKPGISVDLPVPGIQRLIQTGADQLRQFHYETMDVRTIDEPIFRRLFGKPLQQLQEALGPDAGGVGALQQSLQRSVMGRRLPLVWEHGDFYHENLLVDPRTFQLSGILDWGMARQQGLPLVDLFCLLTRGDVLMSGNDWPYVFVEKILPLRLSAVERAMVERYVQDVPVPRELVLPLSVLFWANQIHRSGGVRRERDWVERHVTRVVSAIHRVTR